jgi:hypothetical protein
LSTDFKVGARVRVTNHAEIEGRLGYIVPAGQHQFEDEVTIELSDGDVYYLRPVNLELVPEGVGTADTDPAKALDDSSSFHFFEILLDCEDGHNSSKQFYSHLIEAGLLHASKQQDYGRLSDPFANVRSSEEWGVKPWIGALIRLNDKVRRLQSLATNGSLANEAAVDSFMDIAVYALIARVLYEQELAEVEA